MKLLKFTLILPMIAFLSCTPQPKEESRIKSPGAAPISLRVPAKWSAASLAAPLALKLSDSFYNELSANDFDSSGLHYFDLMLSQWNSVYSNRDFFKVPQANTTNKSYASLQSYYDSEMGIYKSFTWFSEVSSSALAITQYYGLRRNAGSTSEYIELLHADIIVNYRDYTFSYDKNSNTDYDLPSVILHELGHFIGLPHEQEWSVNSVMQPYLSVFDDQRAITMADKQKAADNYGHWSGGALAAVSTQTTSSYQSTSPEELVRGVIELRSNGKCLHYENGKLVLSH